MVRLARIEALLGASVDRVGEPELRRLLDGKVTESQDLEFKSESYDSSPRGRHEFAKDVSALANTVGGLLIVGILERGQVATELSPVEISGEEEARMRQILAQRVVPFMPGVEVLSVPTANNPSLGYYLLVVPRSPHAPHAVRMIDAKGSRGASDALGYARRNGSTTRWLAESEVAAAYRDRLTWANGDAARLEDIRTEGEAQLVPRPDQGHAWLSIALVPSIPGGMVIDPMSLRNIDQYILGDENLGLWDWTAAHAHSTTRTGYHRVVVRLEDTQGRSSYGTFHLHRDGAGYVGVRIGVDTLPDPTTFTSQGTYVHQDHLTRSVYNALRVLTFHAVDRCGASGDATVDATIHASRTPIHIVDRWQPMSITAQPLANVPVGQHTIAIDSVRASPHDWSAASAGIITDLLQSFGLAESQTVSRAGVLRPDRFDGGSERQTAVNLGLPIEPIN